MTAKIIYVSIVSVLLMSCSGDNPQPLSDEIVGAYSGNFNYRPYSAEQASNTENHSAIVANNTESPSYYECSIASLPQIVIFDGITFSNSGKISGDVKLYDTREKIGEVGKEIAGSGVFTYVDGHLNLLWTADPINGGWFFSYDSN